MISGITFIIYADSQEFGKQSKSNSIIFSSTRVEQFWVVHLFAFVSNISMSQTEKKTVLCPVIFYIVVL
jgi:hypothetical protein